MHVEKISETLELTEKEALVYCLLAEKHTANAGELIKASGMYRAAVYDILERLIGKGLIGYVDVGKVREFSIVPLSIVRQKLEGEIEEIKEKENQLKKLELELKKEVGEREPEVHVLKGKRGLLTILNHLIETGKEWHIFGAQGELKKLFPQEYKIIHTKRARKNIAMKIIYNSTVRPEKREQELKLIEVRYVDKKFDSPATTYVYGEFVAIVIWSNPPHITWIKSMDVSKSYENQFQILWRNAKR